MHQNPSKIYLIHFVKVLGTEERTHFLCEDCIAKTQKESYKESAYSKVRLTRVFDCDRCLAPNILKG